MRVQYQFLLLCIIIASGFSKKHDIPKLLRVCYYTLFNPSPDVLNSTLCTHIIAGFSSIRNGLLYMGNETQRKGYMMTTNLKHRNPQLKVLLTVGGGDQRDGFSFAFNSTNNRTRFIVSVLSALNKYNFDGLDIDWEFPVWNDNVPSDKVNFIYFLKEFYVLSRVYSNTTGDAPALLTVAVAAPKNIIDSAYDVPQMSKYVDFINLMSYDFHDYFWYTPFTGHNSPLFNRSVEKAYFATLNTAWAAEYWSKLGMPRSKIMIGIPTYSHTYQLADPKLNHVDDPAVGANKELTFSDVCRLLQTGGTRVFDNESYVPYAYKGYDWVSYEDSISIKGKAKWIISQGFGGSMTYDLNNDDWRCICDKTPFLLHRTLYEIFNAASHYL